MKVSRNNFLEQANLQKYLVKKNIIIFLLDIYFVAKPVWYRGRYQTRISTCRTVNEVLVSIQNTKIKVWFQFMFPEMKLQDLVISKTEL